MGKEELEQCEIGANNGDIPKYYSAVAVVLFSTFFGVIAGCVLMAINLNHTPAKKGVKRTVAFAVLFTTAQIYLPIWSSPSSMIFLATNCLGGIAMRYIFGTDLSARVLFVLGNDGGLKQTY